MPAQAASWAGLLSSLLGCEGTVERRLEAMGTWLDVEISASSADLARHATERFAKAVEDSEGRLSTWRSDTELARLNQNRGDEVLLSPELTADLSAALTCAQDTQGAFDPTLGALVTAWDLRGPGHAPSPRELGEALDASGYLRAKLAGQRMYRPLGLSFDEGGFGKGAALDVALADVLRMPSLEAASIDFGGQVIARGPPRWVPVAHPKRRGEACVEVLVQNESLATSGNSEHPHRLEGRTVGHLLDPRTGQPAADFGTLTVVAASAARADCLSTGLFVMGPNAAQRFADEHDELGVLILDDRGSDVAVYSSRNLRHRLRSVEPGCRLVD